MTRGLKPDLSTVSVLNSKSSPSPVLIPLLSVRGSFVHSYKVPFFRLDVWLSCCTGVVLDPRQTFRNSRGAPDRIRFHALSSPNLLAKPPLATQDAGATCGHISGDGPSTAAAGASAGAPSHSGVGLRASTAVLMHRIVSKLLGSEQPRVILDPAAGTGALPLALGLTGKRALGLGGDMDGTHAPPCPLRLKLLST